MVSDEVATSATTEATYAERFDSSSQRKNSAVFGDDNRYLLASRCNTANPAAHSLEKSSIARKTSGCRLHTYHQKSLVIPRRILGSSYGACSLGVMLNVNVPHFRWCCWSLFFVVPSKATVVNQSFKNRILSQNGIL